MPSYNEANTNQVLLHELYNHKMAGVCQNFHSGENTCRDAPLHTTPCGSSVRLTYLDIGDTLAPIHTCGTRYMSKPPLLILLVCRLSFVLSLPTWTVDTWEAPYEPFLYLEGFQSVWRVLVTVLCLQDLLF